MTDFTRYLANDIAKVAEEVHPYANSSEHGSFVVHPKIIRKALEQVVNSSGVDLGDNANTVFHEVFSHHKQGKTLKGKTLVDATNQQDFKWELYDKGVAFCEREDIEYVGNGGLYYHAEEVEMPQTMAQAVSWFTVAEMKDYLRGREQKVSGKRSEIEQRMIDHVPLGDLHTELLIRYDDRVKGTHYGYLCNKYEVLARFILFRAYHLRHLGQSYYNYKVLPRKGNDKISNIERAFANEVSEGGYDTVFVDGKLAKLLPLFPGSTYDLTTDILGTPDRVKTHNVKKKPSAIKRLLSAFTK